MPTDNPTTGSANPGAIPQDLLNDPTLGPLLSDPSIQAMLMGTGAQSAQPMSLADALVGSAMDVSGRYGITGQRFTGNLPPWAKGLAPEVLNNPDYDPYFGIVSQQGDERVYMGDKIVAPKVDTGAPLTEGMSHADPQSFGWTTDSAGAQAIKDKKGNVVQGTGELDYRSGGQHQMADYSTSKSKDGKAKADPHHADKTLTSTQALNLPYTWSEEEIAAAMKKMQQAGIPVDSFDMGSNSLVAVWGSLVQRASMTYAMSEGATKVTPWDVLDMYKSESKAAGTWQDPNGTKTTVQRTVSDVTEGEAWSTLQQTLSRMLGRDPSDQEIRDYAYRMNQLAAQNPSISKTITQYKNGEAVSSSTKTSGGFTGSDMAQAAYEDAQSNPEYGAYQAASVYFNAALSALGAIGSGG